MNFADRHIGPTAQQRQRMLDAVGYGSLDELTAAAVPAQIAADRALGLPPPLSEERGAGAAAPAGRAQQGAAPR